VRLQLQIRATAVSTNACRGEGRTVHVGYQGMNFSSLLQREGKEKSPLAPIASTEIQWYSKYSMPACDACPITIDTGANH
jgi:L,D-peptidoglycan transpeptidase YkuD (ErfK/YbiS/YcfS/YnhG family)